MRRPRIERSDECSECFGCGHLCKRCGYGVNGCYCDEDFGLDTEEIEACVVCAGSGFVQECHVCRGKGKLERQVNKQTLRWKCLTCAGRGKLPKGSRADVARA